MFINRGMDEENVVCIHNGIHSVIKKNEIMSFTATFVDLDIIILSKISQKAKDKYYIISLYLESKIWHKWTYLQNKNRFTNIENRLCLKRGRECGGRMDWDLWVSRCKLLCIQWINSKVLLYRTGNYIEYPVINLNGKEPLKEYV